jgi:hypothetical protein
MREVTAEAERAVDDMDPATAWPELEAWLYGAVARSTSEHLAYRHDCLVSVVDAVAAVFGDDAGDTATLLAPGGDHDALAPLGGATIDVKPMRIGAQALNLVRGSYGGILMFGALGGLAGIVIATPAVVGVGLLLGGKGLREEKARQLAQRRAQGKVSARRYLDEVTFALTNDQRDTLRTVQRAVRDHFAGRATELTQAARAAHDAASAAMRRDNDERGRRLAFVDAELPKVGVVAQRAEALLAEVTA